MNFDSPTFTSLHGLPSGAPLNATSRELIDQTNALTAKVPAHELTPARRRELMREAGKLLIVADNKPSVHCADIQIPLSGRSLPARLYEPEESSSDALLVFFQGGGWVIGDLETHHPSLQFLALHLGMKVLSVEYRKAPEHVFPAACDDAEQALAWAHSQLASWGCKRIAVSGDSAGGHLAAVAMHSQPSINVAGALLFYPVTDIQFANRSYTERGAGPGLTRDAMMWFWHQFMSTASPPAPIPSSEDPRAVPMRQTWARTPSPTVILAAWHDPLYDEAVSYANLLANAGCKVVLQSAPDMAHGFLRQAWVVSSARAHVLAAVHAFRTLLDTA
jgi:acetyl esterase